LPDALQKFRVFYRGIIEGERPVFALVNPHESAFVIPGQAELQAECNVFERLYGEMIRQQDALYRMVVFGQFFIGHVRAPEVLYEEGNFRMGMSE
jgi:hypothetical protein